jgi:hypothetical protein
MTSTHPNPTNITKLAFTQLLQSYPEVQRAAYKAKIKDPKKLTTAQCDHDWRYDSLPQLVAERNSTYLTKDELVRLIQWKIIHGQHRPFLPGMVKKNEPELVKEVTSSAFSLQVGADYGGDGIPAALDKALREAAQLHGIGPATATLVCSIYDPSNVCFFEDELVAWLCPDLGKLKYTWGEYKAVFAEVGKIRAKLGSDCKAVDVEKVGYVIGHVHLLDGKQREGLMEGDQEEGEAGEDAGKELSKSAVLPDSSDQEETPSNPRKTRTSGTKRKGTPAKTDETKPKAKRRKK